MVMVTYCFLNCSLSRDNSIPGRLVQKKFNFVFQTRFFRKQFSNQMEAVLLQVIPSLCATCSKNSLSISSSTYGKSFARRDYCIAQHDKLCFLLNCRYQNILLKDIDVLLQQLDAFCFTINTWTVFIHYSSINRKNCCQQWLLCREQCTSTKERGEWTKLPALQKKLLRKRYKKNFLSSLQTKKPTQRYRSVFAKRNETVKITKF